MAKKSKGKKDLTKEEAASRANHPTGMSSRQVEIEVIWANKLTMPALMNMLGRIIEEPTGWKKNQRQAILIETHHRTTKLALFTELTMAAAKEYQDIPEVPKTKKAEAARKAIETIIGYLDDNF